MKRLAKWSKANWLVWVVFLAYAATAWLRGDVIGRAAAIGAQTFLGLAVTLVTVFVFVGLFQVWVSDDFVIKHLGEESGFRGLALGAALGTVVHGPLVGIFPLLKTLLMKGARVGVAVAIIATWAIKLPMIPLEVRLFGWEFTLLREGLLLVSAFIVAPVMELALGEAWLQEYRSEGGQEA